MMGKIENEENYFEKKKIYIKKKFKKRTFENQRTIRSY